MLGDFNADGSYFKEDDNTSSLRVSAFTWLIGNDMDTTVASSSNTYDRIVITAAAIEDYIANTAYVFLFDQVFELDCSPGEVSDNYFVFAEFKVGSDSD